MSRRLSLVTLLLLLFALTVIASAEKAVQVYVGDTPLRINGTNSAVLLEESAVPARDMARAFGADVRWDADTGKLFIADGSAQSIVELGSRTGVVNGVQVQFPYAPFLRSGKYYVPLMIFNRMYNMALIWDPVIGAFKWEPIVPPTLTYGPPSRRIYRPLASEPMTSTYSVPATGVVVGEVMRVFPSGNSPYIVVGASGQLARYNVPSDAMIVRGPVSGNGTEVLLGALRPGDKVTINFAPGGTVTTIRAQYKQVGGKIQEITNGMILLESGISLKPGTDTTVILADNSVGEVADLRPGDQILAGASPVSGRLNVVQVVPSADSPNQQVMVNATGPLTEGDTLIIQFKGEPGGKARFSIPGVKSDIEMKEVSPGLYSGEYIVQPGDLLVRQPATVQFTTPSGAVYARTSSHPLTIRSTASYLPKIISPRQGTLITSPLTVSGIAKPGQIVRVTIEYRASMQGVLPMEGLNAVEDVVASDNGTWQTNPMPAVAPVNENDPDLKADFGIFNELFAVSKVPRVVYVITATSLSDNGDPESSYQIEVKKRPGFSTEGITPLPGELIDIQPAGS